MWRLYYSTRNYSSATFNLCEVETPPSVLVSMLVYNLEELLLSSARKGSRRSSSSSASYPKFPMSGCSKTDVRGGRRSSSLPAVIKFFPTSPWVPPFTAQVSVHFLCRCSLTISIAVCETMEGKIACAGESCVFLGSIPHASRPAVFGGDVDRLAVFLRQVLLTRIDQVLGL